jgi:hypothetical protein
MPDPGSGDVGVFAESVATPLLVLHTVLAAAALGAATHAVLWLRRHVRDGAKVRAVRRFGAITAALVAATFAVGLLLYPAYRTRVRHEYLDHPAAIAADVASRQAARASVRGAVAVGPTVAPDAVDAAVARGARTARWFDVKEYLGLIALLAALALALILRAWSAEAARAVGGVVVALAVVVAVCAWLTAIIGVVTTSVRAV